MIFLHVDPSNDHASLLNQYIEEGKDVFVLFYMEGCGPCNATRPEWKKLKDALPLQQKYKNDDNLVIVDVSQDSLQDVKHLRSPVEGFPTMMYISKKGEETENYENSSVKEKNRKLSSFLEWIDTKYGAKNVSKSVTRNKSQKGGKKLTRRTIKNRTGKKNKSKKGKHRWSLKYKRSINCNRPKGFSQKQYCKYGRNK